MTPLARACLHKHVDAAQAFLKDGADMRAVDDLGRNALRCAVDLSAPTIQAGSPGPPSEDVEDVAGADDVRLLGSCPPPETEVKSALLVELLASRGADVEDGGQVAPLLEAIRQSNRLAVQALLRFGAKPRWLLSAIEAAPSGIVSDLLIALANPFERRNGKSALDVAFRRGDEEITTLLRDCIGDHERQHHTFSQEDAEDSEDISEHSECLGLSRETLRLRRRPCKASTPPPQSIPAPRKSLVSFTLLMATEPSTRLPDATIAQTSGLRDVHRVAAKSGAAAASKAVWTALQRFCFWLTENRWFQFVMFTALISVLFFPDLWIIVDVKNNDGLDILLCVIFALFILEWLVQVVALPRYSNSFFFWMDIVGVLSVPLDLSLISDSLPMSFDNAVVMRAARCARLGARAGRFTKLVKLLRFLPGVKIDVGHVGGAGTAKTLSSELMLSLSTRISCLILLMVMVLPLFDLVTYPENDFSMKAWMEALDYTLVNYPSELDDSVSGFQGFFADKDYFPYAITWTFLNDTSGTRELGTAPRRASNSNTISAGSNRVQAQFNFQTNNVADAACNAALLVVVIVLMMGFSLLLSNAVSAIVLQPLETLLSGVKLMASKIFRSVNSLSATMEAKEEEVARTRRLDEAEGFLDETDLLERVIERLAALSAITLKNSSIEAQMLEQMGEDSRAVFQGYTIHAPVSKVLQSPILSLQTSHGGSFASESGGFLEATAADLTLALEQHLQHGDLDWAHVNSWEFDSLAVEEKDRRLVCLCFLIFHFGLGYTGHLQQVFTNFIETAASGYGAVGSVPYHNWNHAVDVAHCVFRFLSLCSMECFLSSHERYALIISSLCHDIGHPGLNNPFLAETSHELAIRYNDRSPLEMMHCATLFEIASHPRTAVFATLDKVQYREVRQVCIEAILHTDNTHHFSMVKDLQVMYEMNSDVFDIAMQMHHTQQMEFPPQEVLNLFLETEKKKTMRNLLLHLSDISNPTKPFPIAKRWAWLIIDEFFYQGDRERELGLVVQPLFDREKVNRPHSQIGFIEFFVVPFVFAAVHVLPPLAECGTQLMTNLHTWCDEWISTTKPKPDAEEQAKVWDRIAKLEAKYVFRDGF